ncbi:MAG: NADH-quinone oxidoreductase subunit N, partial [Sphingobacterium sp.]
MNDFIYHISDNIDHIIRSVPLLKVELILAIGFLIGILCSLFIDQYWKGFSFYITLLTLLGAIAALVTQYKAINTGFFDMLYLDKMSFFSRFIILGTLIIISLYLKQYLENTNFKKRSGDLFSLLLTAGIGLNLLTMTSNWLLAFIGIEIISICSYLLVGYFSLDKKQAEAAMKYALFGAACSAIMLYGLSLVYGFTGELDFSKQNHIQGLITAPVPIISIALLFIFTGIGFKLSFVPFHLWTPDVYQGAPTPVTAFLSSAPKIGILVLLARLSTSWISTGFYFSELTFLIISIAAIITMLAGNLIALRQTDIKRMMAYSSIGHTGFLLMAIVAYGNGHADVLLFYMVVYTLMNLASFGFIDILEQYTGKTSFTAYAGMGKHWPRLFGWLT